MLSKSQLQGKVAEVVAEKDAALLSLEDERAAHVDTLSLATARLDTIDQLKIALKETAERVDELSRDQNSDYIQSLRDALREEVEAAKQLRHLNMDFQKKVQRLEERLDGEDNRCVCVFVSVPVSFVPLSLTLTQLSPPLPLSLSLSSQVYNTNRAVRACIG